MIYGESDHMQVDVGGNFLLGMRDSIQLLGNSKIEGSEIIPNYINPANPSQTIYVLQFNFVNALTTSVDNYGQIVEQIKVYPNPANDFTNIKWEIYDELKDAQYKIYDMNGREIGSGIIEDNTGEKIIDTRSLENGVYIINIYNDGVVKMNSKLIVSNEK